MAETTDLVAMLRARARVVEEDNDCISATMFTEAADALERLSAPVDGQNKIAAAMLKIADASRRGDGTDIPLGEQCRAAASEIARLQAEVARLRALLHAPKGDTDV